VIVVDQAPAPGKATNAAAVVAFTLGRRHGRLVGAPLRELGLPRVGREPILVRAIKERLRTDLQTRLTLTDLAREFNLTPFVLLRAFVRETGLSPHAFQQQVRVGNAILLLQRGMSIAEVSAATGFADQPHFTRVFKQQMGVTPKIYQAVFA